MSQAPDRPARVVFLDRDTISPETVLRPLSFAHELEMYDRTTPEQVAGRIADADIVITNKAPIREASLSGAERLKLVAVAATGTDVVDVKAAAARGVTVSNIRNYAGNTVPEHTFALILALRRSIIPYRQSVGQGRWREAAQFCYFDYPIRDLAGSTLGVIGDGVLGKAVAKLGEAFGMNVLFSDYKGTTGMGPLYTPFLEVLRRSDIITLHLPLMPSTRNLIGAAEFAAMERKPLLINTARGGLVDEAALAAALRSGQISGAGFDVVTTEPPPEDHPLVQLLELPNFILTPHVAWASQEAIQGLADQLIDNVEAFWAGSPRNVVVPAYILRESTMKLYYSPGACSLGIHVLLEEIGKPYELARLNLAEGEQRKPEFAAVNRKGKVPTLVRNDGTVLTEFPAIAWWLALSNPGAGLVPGDAEGQARALEALDYIVGSIHGQGFGRIFRPAKFTPSDADHEEVQAQGRQLFVEGMRLMDEALTGKEYLLGEFSIADAALFYVEFWATRVGIDLPSNCAAHFARMKARPAVRRALEQEGLPT